MKMRRLRLPFSPLAASWFSLDGNMKTKGRISPRLSSLDQIHPDMKREQLPSGVVPAYSLCGDLPVLEDLSTCFAVCCFSALLASLLGSGNMKSSDLQYKGAKWANVCLQVTERGENGIALPIAASPLASVSRRGWWGCAAGRATEEHPRWQGCTAPRRSGAAVLPSRPWPWHRKPPAASRRPSRLIYDSAGHSCGSGTTQK